MSNSNPLQGWHVSKTISIGHLLTTAVILTTVMWFFSQQEARLGQAELNILNLQMRQDDMQQRTNKKFDVIRAYMVRIDQKLDRIIERE